MPPDQVVPMPSIGQDVGGKYRLERVIGEGGMASVFEAWHQRLGQKVAIKVLAPEFARDRELVERFEREARAVWKLRTPHVARVIDVDATLDGLPYIVMEYLEGRDLEAELAARGTIPAQEAVDYMLQACAAMNEAHAMGIVHRDLKPANLFLANEGNDRIVKVLDFGISKVVGAATRLTAAGAVMGTVMYMSPEQIRAAADVDIRADIWSMGVILFELVAGRPPWTGASPQIAAAIVGQDPPDVRTLASVPDGVANAIARALSRDRTQRFPGVRELAFALTPYAPPTSIGAQVGEQVLMGTNSRRRVATADVPLKATLPMGMTPPPPAPPPSPRAATASFTAGAPPRAQPPHSQPSSKLPIAIGVLFGLLAAGVVAFVLFAKTGLLQKPLPPPPPSAPPSVSVPPPPTPPATSAAPPGSSSAAPKATTSGSGRRPHGHHP